MTADKLGNLLNRNENGELGDLVRRAQALDSLCRALTAALPADLAADVLAANVREGGELVVICPTPARAARLRFESEALLAAATAAGESVTHLTVRVTHQGDQA
mgnify:CR=1 FL=1